MTAHYTQNQLAKMISTRFLGAFIVLGVIFFWPAGTFAYWQAWVYMVVIIVPAAIALSYMIRKSPELIERRMRMREREAEQKRIITLAYIPFLVQFLLPGFDFRYGWSHVPLWLVITADILVLTGYTFILFVFRENRFASRVVEVETEQTVISTGPYAVVRHPMYLGVLLMYSITPLALGSYWALIPAVWVFPVLVLRILNEEKVLSRDLNGYPEYMQKVKYRLIPGVW